MNEIYWHELIGNKWFKKLEPTMLTSDGLKIKQAIKPVGRPSLGGKLNDAKWYEVTYNREYVVSYLTKNVVESLNLQSLDYLIELLIEAWLISNNHSLDSVNETSEILDKLNGKAPGRLVDLSKIKRYRLHNKTAIYVSELISELDKQGYVVEQNQNYEQAS